ncbi:MULTISPECIES: TasA family protein [Clostridia]|uniref:TasA family protein n=1 Tax=Clostridia TaxID=186801 RepID=UPI000EA04F5D|nr:TasA family protein [Clostridium sp. 1xD42-85]NBJ69575.1 cell division protein FtsN [Roseburia sp. 1XD42-34]RKI78363.1 cell division protein FtsN [Clostridium sp. 1xD42-85]
MDIKKKLGISIITAMLGVILISGGTYSYFNDNEETTNTFATGLLNLGINKTSIIDIENLVPGDRVNGHFKLTNDGTVDMKEVVLHSDYEVVDKGENNKGEDLADYITVEYLHHVNGNKNVIFKKKLSEMKNKSIPVLEQFPVNSDAENFSVRFSFMDNKKSQNHFQGDYIRLQWRFEAMQRDGKPNFQ